MRQYRFTACDCGQSNYRLLPRHWWMRALPGRRRYKCKNCGRTMLLRTDASLRRSMRKSSVLLVLVALVLAAYVSFHAVGYREDWSYASWKRWAEGQ